MNQTKTNKVELNEKKSIPKKCWVNEVGTLYHLSEQKFKDGKVMRPRIPHSVAVNFGHSDDHEDATLGRVCFSTSMSGAFRAISYDGDKEELYVYVLNNKDELLKNHQIVRPTTDMVWDQHYTSEHWVMDKCVLKCIGKASLSYNPHVSWRQTKPNVKIRWIEKF